MPAQTQTDSKTNAPACTTQMTELRLSTEAAEHLAGLSKALGHPVRVQIVEMLGRYEGEVCVCDVERHFDLTQPTISHHLRVLRKAGIIDGEQRGLWIYYHIRPGVLDPLRELLGILD